MSRSRERGRRGRRNRGRFQDGEGLDPMNYVSNLSDVMLILAVGIMLALVLHWNVSLKAENQADASPETNQAVSFSDDDLQSQDELPEDMEHMGEVYYDTATGKYYILQDP